MSLPKAPLWMQKMAFERRLVEIAARSGLRLPTGWRFFERSPLMKADHAAFLMRKGKTGAACVMTGAFGRDGFLSTPFADDEAAADALLGELVALQKQWGARRIVAPVSPRLFDTDGGLTVQGLDAETSCFSTDALPFWDELLQRYGFAVTGTASLYALDEARFPAERYARAARESMRRFGYRVVSARSMGLGAAGSAMARRRSRFSAWMDARFMNRSARWAAPGRRKRRRLRCAAAKRSAICLRSAIGKGASSVRRRRRWRRHGGERA